MSFFARLLGIASPRAPQNAFEAGLAALEDGQLDEALHSFAIALEAAAGATQRALVLNKCGLVQLRRADRPAAVDAFVAALTADERCVPAIVNIGNLLLEDGVLDEAVAHYEAALRIDPDYAGAHLNLGIAYKRLGRRAEAVRSFRRAHRLESRRRRP